MGSLSALGPPAPHCAFPGKGPLCDLGGLSIERGGGAEKGSRRRRREDGRKGEYQNGARAQCVYWGCSIDRFN